MARWNLSSWLSHSVTQQPYVPATPAAVRGQVYVQELPARFNADVDMQLRFGSGIAYRASRVLHEFVRSSDVRALRAQDANAIWVPLYTGFVGRRRILNHASKLHEVDAEKSRDTYARTHSHTPVSPTSHTPSGGRRASTPAALAIEASRSYLCRRNGSRALLPVRLERQGPIRLCHGLDVRGHQNLRPGLRARRARHRDGERALHKLLLLPRARPGHPTLGQRREVHGTGASASPRRRVFVEVATPLFLGATKRTCKLSRRPKPVGLAPPQRPPPHLAARGVHRFGSLVPSMVAPRSSRRTNGCALCTRARSPHRCEGGQRPSRAAEAARQAGWSRQEGVGQASRVPLGASRVGA